MKELLTYNQTAEMLGIPRGTLYALVHQGRIPHIRFGKRLVRFSREALEEFIERSTVPTRTPVSAPRQEVRHG